MICTALTAIKRQCGAKTKKSTVETTENHTCVISAKTVMHTWVATTTQRNLWEQWLTKNLENGE